MDFNLLSGEKVLLQNVFDLFPLIKMFVGTDFRLFSERKAENIPLRQEFFLFSACKGFFSSEVCCRCSVIDI